jgi:hypothetical protein
MNWPFRILFFLSLTISLIINAQPRRFSKKTTTSSIKGQVVEQVGNSMPSKGKLPYKGRPLSTKIFIYQPLQIGQLENQNGAYCSQIKGVLVKSVLSDSTGYYHIDLKPGKYSIAVGYDNGFFIPYFSGAEGVAYILLEIGKPQILNITVNQKASY